MFAWFSLLLSLPELQVAWQVTVPRVVDVFSDSVHKWIVVVVKLVVSQSLVVLNSITILIGDTKTMPAKSRFRTLTCIELQERNFIFRLDEFQVLWTLNVVDQECKSATLSDSCLQVLVISHAIRRLSLKHLLAQVLGGQL